MRTLLVSASPKNFKIEIPDDAKITFGPFSPPKNDSSGRTFGYNPVGTLRIYQGTKDNIIGMFTQVYSFRDITNIHYEEEVAREEGAIIWKSDEKGYTREEKVARDSAYVTPAIEQKKGKGVKK